MPQYGQAIGQKKLFVSHGGSCEELRNNHNHLQANMPNHFQDQYRGRYSQCLPYKYDIKRQHLGYIGPVIPTSSSVCLDTVAGRKEQASSWTLGLATAGDTLMSPI